MEKPKMILRSVLAVAALFSMAATQCNNATCEQLRDDLYAEKLDWERCSSDADCIKIGGNPNDCTGILSCDFAVNKSRRIEAERRVASLAEETVDCIECGDVNCRTGDLAICEQVSGRCIIVTDIVEPEDGGAMLSPPEEANQ